MLATKLTTWENWNKKLVQRNFLTSPLFEIKYLDNLHCGITASGQQVDHQILIQVH